MVSRVEDAWLLVSLTASLRALVPALHASDLGTAKGLRKFKEGQKVQGRVLSVDPGAQRGAVWWGWSGACVQPLLV